MRITVFTPIYNRGYIIGNLYHSLQRQSFRDFEWIVVDDGSTDNTESLFQQFQTEGNSFPIYYIKTANGGKHRAINRGVRIAHGELFLIVDSDDYLTDDALETIDRIEQTIPSEQRRDFAGVCGQRGYSTDTPIGKTFEGNVLDITTLERPKHNIYGDKAEVFYTDILKKYPFPEFEGENFITECVVWDRIAWDGYKLRFYNQISIVCNYLDDGLTAQGNDIFLRNPKGYGLYLHQCGKFGKLFGIEKWNAYLRYYYEMRNRHTFLQISRNLCMNPVILWARLFGLRLFYKLYDR